jgi:hypothetical protein
MIAQLKDRLKRLQHVVWWYWDLGRFSREVEEAAGVRNTSLLDEFEGWLKTQKLANKTVRKYRGKVEGFSVFLVNEAYSPYLTDARAGDMVSYWMSDYAPFDGEDDLDHLLAALDRFFAFLVQTGYAPEYIHRELERAIEGHSARLYRRAEYQDRH